MIEIDDYISTIQETIARLPVNTIQQVIDVLYETRLRGSQVFTMGNGGSASTASHFVCDLSKNTRKENWPPFRVIGLTDNIASLSAYANDEGYEHVFAQQLASLVQPGDVVIGISTSGNSKNVLLATELAKKVGAKTIGFTGFNGGQLGPMVDINICVPSNCIEQVEDVHLMLEHMICTILRERLENTPLTTELYMSFRKELSKRPNLQELAQSILQLTLDGIGASSGSIMLLDKQGGVKEGALLYNGEIRRYSGQQFTDIVNGGLAGWVVENQEPTLVANTRDDPRWLRRSWDEDSDSSRSAISVPLMVNDRIVGVMTLVQSLPGQFNTTDLAMLTAITVCMSLANYKIE